MDSRGKTTANIGDLSLPIEFRKDTHNTQQHHDVFWQFQSFLSSKYRLLGSLYFFQQITGRITTGLRGLLWIPTDGYEEGRAQPMTRRTTDGYEEGRAQPMTRRT